MRRILHKSIHVVSGVDWWCVGAIVFLLTVGLLMQYTIGLNQETPDLGQFNKQLMFAFVGAALFIGALFIDPRQFRFHPMVYVGIAVLLLVGVLLFGREIKGTTGWFVLFGFSFQPVELVKALFLFFIASYLEKDAAIIHNPRYFYTTAAICAALVGLIILQPDLGSAAVISAMWFFLMLVVRVPWRYMLPIIGVAIVAFMIGWFGLFEQYQKDRLTTFLNPEADPLGTGYNITQSIVAVGSGGLWGKGLGFGTQSQLHFLPEVASDFVFAAIAEELGFVGVVLLLTAIGILLYRLWIYAKKSTSSYTFVFVLGVMIYLCFQSTVVIGMNIGVLPVTGLPLPLVSAGGSSLVVTLFLLGIAHRMGMNRE